VLAAATIFAFSLMFAPRRGVIGWAVRRLKMRLRAASVRGLLAMADGYLPPDGLSYQVIRLRGYIDGDARITESGRRAAAEMRRQDRLWQTYRTRHPDAALAFNPLSGLRIEDVLSADIIAALEGPAK
jgi:manganese/zinc/iron transport system permease protein